MICSNCYKSFEGAGTFCPSCKPHQSEEQNRERYKYATQSIVREGDLYPAGMIGRIVAFLFDEIMVGVVITLIIIPLLGSFVSEYLIAGILPALTNSIFLLVASAMAAFIATILLMAFATPLYYVLFETSRFQATPGKILVGLKVTDLNGNKISAARSIARGLSRWIGIIPIICMLFIPFLSHQLNMPELRKMYGSFFWLSVILFLITYPIAFFNIHKQGVHDYISGCIVQEKDGDYGKGFLFALGFVVLFFALIIIFRKELIKHERQNQEEKLAELESMGFVIKPKKQIVPQERKTVYIDPALMDKQNESIAIDMGSKSENNEPLPVLEEGMSAAVNQKVIKFSKVVARAGATLRTVTLDFYRDENAKQADFRIALFFKWPLKARCDLSELERYELIFQGTTMPESYQLPEGMKNMILSRFGNPPAGETVGLSCSLKGNAMNMKAFFKGNSAPKGQHTYQWNIAASADFDLVR